LIKSDSASVIFPSLDFEIPPKTQKGEISTVEGFISTAARNLSLYQRERMEQDPTVGAKVAEIIGTLIHLV
jgi:zinc finger protein